MRNLSRDQIIEVAQRLLDTDDEAWMAVGELGIDPDTLENPERGLSSIGGITRCRECAHWHRRGTCGTCKDLPDGRVKLSA